MPRPVVVMIAMSLAFAVAGCTASAIDPKSANTKTQSSSVKKKSPAKKNQTTTAAKQAAVKPVSNINEQTPVTLMSITGIPQTAATDIQKSLRQAAQDHAVNLANPNRPQADISISGYFTALNDGTGTLLIYVWDVKDKNGRRLHRFTGQERNDGTSPDPWRSVNDETISAVAVRSMASLKSWLSSQ